MRWNGEVYAAKIFYNIGSDSTGVPSLEENLKHLKEELICAKIAENSLSAFNRKEEGWEEERAVGRT